MYTIMSFCERKTDLFDIKKSEQDKKGFMEGQAEKIVKDHFHLFQQRYLQRAQPHLLAQFNAGDLSAGTASSASASSRQAIEGGADTGAGSCGGSASASGAGVPSPTRTLPDGVNASPLEGGDPGLWERMQQSGEGFSWTQSDREVTVEIGVEKCTARQIKVDFASSRVCVKRDGKVLLEGKLHDKINCEDSTWHLDDGKLVVLSLDKIKPMWWPNLCVDGTGVPSPM